MLRISSHIPFPRLQERSLGYARDDGMGKRSPHICFQPITQKVAKENAASPYRHSDRIGQRYLQNRRLGILVNRLLETHFPTRFYTASVLSAPTGHLPLEGKAIHTRGEAAT